jgi:hypothetical protein
LGKLARRRRGALVLAVALPAPRAARGGPSSAGSAGARRLARALAARLGGTLVGSAQARAPRLAWVVAAQARLAAALAQQPPPRVAPDARGSHARGSGRGQAELAPLDVAAGWEPLRAWLGCCGGRWNVYALRRTPEDGDGAGEVEVVFVEVRVRGAGGTERLSSGDLAWGARLSWLLARKAGLATANAFVSTLGGGYFLCKQIDRAEQMALRQLSIALSLGDPALAVQCRVHLAYNQLQRGRLRFARALLEGEWLCAKALGDDVLQSMVKSAWLYLRRLRQLRALLARPAQGDTTRDAFYRQRFTG